MHHKNLCWNHQTIFENSRKFRKFWCENWLAGVVIRFLWRSKSWIKRPLCISHPSSTNFNPQARFWIGEIEWKRPLIGYRYLRFRFSPPTIQTCYFEWVKRRCEPGQNDAQEFSQVFWHPEFQDMKYKILRYFENSKIITTSAICNDSRSWQN